MGQNDGKWAAEKNWESNALGICCYTCDRRVKRREGKPRRSARAIRATIIHPSDASASTVLRWKRPPARPPTTGAFLYAPRTERLRHVAGFSYMTKADTTTCDACGTRYAFTSYKDRCPVCCPKSDKSYDVFSDDVIQESDESYIPELPTE